MTAPLPNGYLTHCAKLAGITRQGVFERIQRGWPLHALHRKRRPKGETVESLVRLNAKLWGLDKPTVSVQAQARGLPPSTVYRRVNTLGWTLEEALAAPATPRVWGRVPGSLRDLAARAGLPYGTVALRIYKLGWTKERALSTPIDQKRSAAAKAGKRRARERRAAT